MKMQGWKTWAGAAALFISGVGQILSSIDWETWTVDGDGINAGIIQIGMALGLVGIGHKIEKNKPL